MFYNLALIYRKLVYATGASVSNKTAEVVQKRKKEPSIFVSLFESYRNYVLFSIVGHPLL